MPTEELIVMGSSIVNNPIGYSQDPRGDENDGAYLTGGESVFEDDDVVVFTVANVNADGTFDNQTQITGITVYDSAADYLNGEAKYDYTLTHGGWWWGQNTSGQISTAVHDMGDTYLYIEANNFTSTDPNAPDLDGLFLAPGVDLSEEFPIWLSHEQDVDYNADGTIAGNESGDGVFTTDNNIFAEDAIAAAVCLARGTLIDTPEGPRFIETLQVGDRVHTLDHGPQEIRWTGSRRVAAKGALAPIRITAGTLGNLRDLTVSPNHRMLIRGPMAEMLFGERDVLVAAKHLVNDDTIRAVPGGQVEYFHLLLDRHEIIFAETCPTESLHPGQEALKAVDAAARAEILTLFPELETRRCALSRYELKAWEAQALQQAS
ncbi:Hint domain-containing protein [Celeribacter ethanolicus]|uniref:Hint domain-containing protein n=1 Tax=Celeribacter ethanolicus TaxID=1758178 RepID=UPI00082A1AD1|nr:Hint domain-containing protein [Celeribacter ethanolicus]